MRRMAHQAFSRLTSLPKCPKTYLFTLGGGEQGSRSLSLARSRTLSPLFSLMWTTDDPGMHDPPGIRVCMSLWVWNTAICHRAHSYTRHKATSFVDLNGELNFPRTVWPWRPHLPRDTVCERASGPTRRMRRIWWDSRYHMMMDLLFTIWQCVCARRGFRRVWEHLRSWLAEC